MSLELFMFFKNVIEPMFQSPCRWYPFKVRVFFKSFVASLLLIFKIALLASHGRPVSSLPFCGRFPGNISGKHLFCKSTSVLCFWALFSKHYRCKLLWMPFSAAPCDSIQLPLSLHQMFSRLAIAVIDLSYRFAIASVRRIPFIENLAYEASK